MMSEAVKEQGVALVWFARRRPEDGKPPSSITKRLTALIRKTPPEQRGFYINPEAIDAALDPVGKRRRISEMLIISTLTDRFSV
jgi:hypothetical protein